MGLDTPTAQLAQELAAAGMVQVPAKVTAALGAARKALAGQEMKRHRSASPPPMG